MITTKDREWIEQRKERFHRGGESSCADEQAVRYAIKLFSEFQVKGKIPRDDAIVKFFPYEEKVRLGFFRGIAALEYPDKRGYPQSDLEKGELKVLLDIWLKHYKEISEIVKTVRVGKAQDLYLADKSYAVDWRRSRELFEQEQYGDAWRAFLVSPEPLQFTAGYLEDESGLGSSLRIKGGLFHKYEIAPLMFDTLIGRIEELPKEQYDVLLKVTSKLNSERKKAEEGIIHHVHALARGSPSIPSDEIMLEHDQRLREHYHPKLVEILDT